MGSFTGGSHEVRNVIGDLARDFAPDAYHLIYKNCNHFANAFVYKLLHKEIPPFVNRLANIGRCMSCILPKKMLETAPVGGSGGSIAGGTAGGALFRAYPPSGSSSGSGGGGVSSRWNTHRSNSSSVYPSTVSYSSSRNEIRRKGQHDVSRVEEDGTDLREKVRLAAIKRWENQKK